MNDRKVHEKNILYLKKLFDSEQFNWIDYDQSILISYFNTGGGTHLYLIKNSNQKYLARINFYPGKNEWGVKKQEYDVLSLIKSLKISPKAYYFNDNNPLKQDFTIVEYIEGEILDNVTDKNIVDLAADLLKFHTSFQYDKF